MIAKWTCSCGSQQSVGTHKCQICGTWRGTQQPWRAVRHEAPRHELEIVREVLTRDLKIASERVLTLELENQRLRRALLAACREWECRLSEYESDPPALQEFRSM